MTVGGGGIDAGDLAVGVTGGEIFAVLAGSLTPEALDVRAARRPKCPNSNPSAAGHAGHHADANSSSAQLVPIAVIAIAPLHRAAARGFIAGTATRRYKATPTRLKQAATSDPSDDSGSDRPPVKT